MQGMYECNMLSRSGNPSHAACLSELSESQKRHRLIQILYMPRAKSSFATNTGFAAFSASQLAPIIKYDFNAAKGETVGVLFLCNRP